MADTDTQKSIAGSIGTIVDYFVSPKRKAAEVYAKPNSPDEFYPASAIALDIASSGLSGSYARHTTDLAINESELYAKYALERFKDTVLPEFYKPAIGAGAYNATSLELLAGVALAKTIAEVNKDRISSIAAYAQVRSSDAISAANILGAVKGSVAVGSLAGGTTGGTSVGSLIIAGLTLYNGIAGGPDAPAPKA